MQQLNNSCNKGKLFELLTEKIKLKYIYYDSKRNT